MTTEISVMYGSEKVNDTFRAGIDFRHRIHAGYRRQILTSKDGPRTKRIQKYDDRAPIT